MKILGHIHTLNDEEVINQSLQALLDQTYPVQKIIVVDNGSTDSTLQKLSSKPVTVLRHSENLGTSGSVVTGLKYAIANQYDWIWIFDADSAPCKDALEKLVELYQNFPPDLQERVWLLSSLHVEDSTRIPYYQLIFTSKGFKQVCPSQGKVFHEFDSSIWSGSLYKLEVVKKIGLPSVHYVLDWGEHEYGYRGKQYGYRAFLHQDSIVNHNIGGGPALHFTSYRFGPVSFRMRELPPIRCYYLVRNLIYFWLYEYHIHNFYTLSICFFRVAKLTASFLLRPITHGAELSACLRGIRDGILKKIHHRY